MVLGDVLRCDSLGLVELATVPRGDAQLLARAQQALGELGVVGGVVAVDEGIVTSLEDKAGNVHGGLLWSDPGLNGGLGPGPELATNERYEVSIEFWWGS